MYDVFFKKYMKAYRKTKIINTKKNNALNYTPENSLLLNYTFHLAFLQYYQSPFLPLLSFVKIFIYEMVKKGNFTWFKDFI